MSRRTVLAVGAVALAAFVFRVWVVAEVAVREPDGGDPLYYHLQANLLVAGHGFAEPFVWRDTGTIIASAIHPPGFSLWLAAASALGFDTVFSHKVMSALAGGLTVVVLGALAHRLAGPRVALAVAVLAAVHPNLWVIDGALMPEALFGLTVALVLAAAYRARSLRGAALVGAAIGAATLVRGEALLFVPLLGGWLALRPEAAIARDRVLRLAVVGAATVAVVTPWTIRNLVTFDRPVLVSANGDEVLRNANCDRTWSGPLVGFWSVECYQPDPPPELDEAERAAFWRRAGVAYAREHADRLPYVVATRVGRVWDVYRPSQNVDLSTVEGRDGDVARVGQLVYFALVPLAAVGLVVLRRRGVPVWPLASTVVVVTATSVYAYGVTRFRVPAELALVVLAGSAIGSLRRPTARGGTVDSGGAS
jgi:hypothetical protein